MASRILRPALLRPTLTTTATRPFTTTLPSLSPSKQAEKQPPSKEKPKKAGIIGSFLHGSEKAKQEGDTMQSHSTAVGKSNNIHEVQKHRVHPHCVEEYKVLIEEYFAKLGEHPDPRMKLLGSWETVVGELDTFVHIWEYEGYGGYDTATARIGSDADHQALLAKIRPMIQSRSSQICREFAFWPHSGPRTTGGIYEMRSYALKPGTLLEWEHSWRLGLEARRKFVEPIGAWFAQVGRLHQVHHMWSYSGMEERWKTREQAWQVDGWGKTVVKTVKLCDSMDAQVLVPLSFSPLK